MLERETRATTGNEPSSKLCHRKRAYNARRQRVLGGLSPDQAVRQRMKANPKLASKGYEPPSDPCVLPKALLVVTAAKQVSHPDS
jgi:hypothetical protein